MQKIIFLTLILCAPQLSSMDSDGDNTSVVQQLQAPPAGGTVTMSENDPLIPSGQGCRAECRACCQRECEGLRPMATVFTAVSCIFCAVIMPSAICACH